MSIICQHVHRLELRRFLKLCVAHLSVKREILIWKLLSDMHVQNLKDLRNSSLWTCSHVAAILRRQKTNIDLLMILALLCRFNYVAFAWNQRCFNVGPPSATWAQDIARWKHCRSRFLSFAEYLLIFPHQRLSTTYIWWCPFSARPRNGYVLERGQPEHTLLHPRSPEIEKPKGTRSGRVNQSLSLYAQERSTSITSPSILHLQGRQDTPLPCRPLRIFTWPENPTWRWLRAIPNPGSEKCP